MTGRHPLELLSAVVDGGLDHDSRDRVLGHLVGCDSCRSEVDAQRRLKARMAALEAPEPSTDLMQRLLGVSSFATEPREEVRPVSLSPQRSVFPAARPGPARSHPARSDTARPDTIRPDATRPGVRGTRPRRRTSVIGAASSAAAVATLLGTAFVVGEPARQERLPAVQPPVASFSSDHATTTGGAPFADPVVLVSSFNGAGYAGLSPTYQPVALTGR